MAIMKKLRNRKNAKKVWIVLAILILPAFVLWGAGSVARNKQPDSVEYAGIINGRKVSLIDYRDAYNAVNNLAIIQFGDSLPDVKKLMNFEAQAWERLVLLAEAKKRRISASDSEVITAIQGFPFFQRNKRFDDKTYNEMLQYVFRTPARAFEEQTRQNLIISKLYKQVTPDIQIPETQVRSEYEKANEQISLYYIAGVPSEFVKDVTASDEELKDYFAKNSLNFKRPMSFNLEYAAVSSQGQDDPEVKDKLKKIFSRLEKKEDFSAVAKDFALTLKETGLFSETDPIPGIGWAPKVTSLISQAKPGEYLPAMRMDNAYYIARIKEIKEPYIPSFDSIKDKVKETLIKDKTQALAKSKIETAVNELKENPDFDKAAKDTGLKAGSTNTFKYGSYIEGIGASDIFWTKAKELKDGAFSGIIEIPGGFYIIKIKSAVPIDEKKFTDEKADFTNQLVSQKRSEYFSKFTQELKSKARSF